MHDDIASPSRRTDEAGRGMPRSGRHGHQIVYASLLICECRRETTMRAADGEDNARRRFQVRQYFVRLDALYAFIQSDIIPCIVVLF